LKFWDEPIAAQYGVQFQLLLYLMLGKIVARDLRGDELRAKIEELLAK
jgi:hypothetical protein